MPVTPSAQAPLSEATLHRLIGKFGRAESKLKRDLRTVKSLLSPDNHDDFLITPQESLNTTSQDTATRFVQSTDLPTAVSNLEKEKLPSDASVCTV